MATSKPQQAPNGLSKLSHDLVIELRDRLKESGHISRLHYIPGSYRGKSDITQHMDNLFVKTDPTIRQVPSTNFKGCVFLENDKGGRITAQKGLENFKQTVMLTLNAMGIGHQIRLKVVSPALELTCFAKRWSSTPSFVVDLVFCYEVEGDKNSRLLFLPHSPDGATGTDTDLWTRVKVANDNRTIVDEQSVIRRWSVQIFRALTSCDNTLKILSADVIEQAINYVKTETPSELWRERDLKRAVEMLLKFVTSAVQNNLLKKQSSRSIGENVLPPMSGIVRDDVVRSLQRLSSDTHIRKVMDAL